MKNLLRNTGVLLLLSLLLVAAYPLLQPLLFQGDYHNRKATQTLALVLSTTADNREANRAIRDGVNFYLRQQLVEGQTSGLPRLEVLDDKGSVEKAREIAAELAGREDVIAVIGHVDPAISLDVAPVYQSAGLPLLSVMSSDRRLMSPADGLFSVRTPNEEQGRFMAGYAVYAQNKFQAAVVRPEKMPDTLQQWLDGFSEIAAAEGLLWEEKVLPADLAEGETAVYEQILQELREAKTDIVFLALESAEAERMIETLRHGSFQQSVVLDSALATPLFAQRFRYHPREKKLGYYTNGLLVPVPFILDMSSDKAQAVNESYHAVSGVDISWPFALAYDASSAVHAAMQRQLARAGDEAEHATVTRARLRDGLAAMNSLQSAINGISGPVFFPENGEGLRLPLVATFQNRTLISALTQLLPSDMPVEIYDPFEHVGMVAFSGMVSNMAHIVYTGSRLTRIADIDAEKRTFFADFEIWFRYYGQFNPGNIVFDHAVEDAVSVEVIEDDAAISLAAEGSDASNLVQYKKLRVKGLFYYQLTPVDFLLSKTRFHLSFRNRDYTRGELVYVVDRTAFNTNEFNMSFFEQVRSDRVIAEAEELAVSSAVLYQNTVGLRAYGHPAHLHAQREFSHFNIDLETRRMNLSLPGKLEKWLSAEVSLLLLCLSVILLLATCFSPVALLLGHWVALSRSLLLGAGMLAFEMYFYMDFANRLALDLATLSYLVKLMEALWYLYFAWMTHVVMTRHFWPHVEQSTGYPVPSIARTIVSIVIFVVAVTLIYSVVFEKSAMSVVATSGALTVVLGFALRELIMDFFAGIILNIERPFHIGDYVQFHIGRGLKVEGFVREMNWRTVRLTDDAGNLVVLPNNQISVEHLVNGSVARFVEWRVQVFVDAQYSPEQVLAVLRKSVLNNPYVIGYDDDDMKPSVRYRGVENVSGIWVARYRVKVALKHMGMRTKATEALWLSIWQHFGEAGIAIDPMLNAQGDRKVAAIPAKTQA